MAVLLLLAWLRRLVFDRIDMEWYWEKWAIVTASGWSSLKDLDAIPSIYLIAFQEHLSGRFEALIGFP